MKDKKAVAISYNKGDFAPRVLAKGTGKSASMLCSIARSHGIPIIESKQLAEDLVNLNTLDDVPEKFWMIVAEILSFVYETKPEVEEL